MEIRLDLLYDTVAQLGRINQTLLSELAEKEKSEEMLDAIYKRLDKSDAALSDRMAQFGITIQETILSAVPALSEKLEKRPGSTSDDEESIEQLRRRIAGLEEELEKYRSESEEGIKTTETGGICPIPDNNETEESFTAVYDNKGLSVTGGNDYER